MKRSREVVSAVSSGSLFSIATYDQSEGSQNNICDQSTVFYDDNRTGLIFESSPDHYDRHNRYHKERPIRVTSTQDYLLNQSPFHFSHRCVLLSLSSDPNAHVGMDYCEEIHSDDIFSLSETDLLRVHSPSYLHRFRTLQLYCSRHNGPDDSGNVPSNAVQNRLDHEQAQYPSVYLTSSSYSCALVASSSLCLLVSHVVSSRLHNGFAIIRPPGHHAEPCFTGGYCILNHIAIAASYAIHQFPHIVRRILIVDWDVHHGNGTQRMFIDRSDVLYFSIHRYHGGNYFPFTTNKSWNKGSEFDSLVNFSSGSSQVIGIGTGQGFNINVGWEEKGMGDPEYLAVWEFLLMPVAREYQPDLILISAGFDSAVGDMGECCVTPECFGTLTRQLMTLANGKVICSLEGGYVRSILHKCLDHVLCALLEPMATTAASTVGPMNSTPLQSTLPTIQKSAAASLCATIRAHQPYWKSLQYDLTPS